MSEFTNRGKLITGSIVIMLISLCSTLNGQAEKKFIRQGNGLYKEAKYSDSEISYRKALDKNKMSQNAGFNLGDALYRQNKFDDAGKQFLGNSSATTSGDIKSANLYNLGNSLLKNNKVEESIEAYKNSLKINPGSKEAKYNLAYAQDLLKKQQQQQQQQNQKKDQDKKNDNKKDDKNKDQNKEQNKENKKDQNQNSKQDQSKQQQQSISKEDAERLLNAIANDEKNVQEKVKLAKAAKEKVRTRINW
jgi:Ca-activated chloride channel family protein